MDFKLMEKNGWIYSGQSEDEQFYKFWSHKFKKMIFIKKEVKNGNRISLDE